MFTEKKLSDDAENNTAIASVGSKNTCKQLSQLTQSDMIEVQLQKLTIKTLKIRDNHI